MFRKTAVLGAGIIMAATVAWTGGIASATQPASKITAGSKWTSFSRVAAAKSRRSAHMARGLPIGTKMRALTASMGAPLDEQWTKGADKGLSFDALYNKAKNDYKGQFGGIAAGSGKLVKGAESSC